MISNGKISENCFWYNEPKFKIDGNRLLVTTEPDTDFWQRTHYGFKRDNGHCLLTKIDRDFAIMIRTEFTYKNQYDQCGLIIRADSENWIKTSVEYETENHSRLGSVVTNLGYSDWATIDINSSINNMWYRIQRKQNDFLIEYSIDGLSWKQLRIAHMLCSFSELNIGLYACSPLNSSFEAVFDNYKIGESNW